MLSPSRLFFGGDDDGESPADEKPAWSRGVLDLLNESDAEEQTDVPGEHSNEASLNESDEERRSPAVAAGASGGSLDRPPPGLRLLSTAPPEQEEALGAAGDCGEDLATSPPFSELPSIGSANHFSGTCDRCCFHPKGRCLNGFNCQHCHYDHEKRKRKSKKKGKDYSEDPVADGFGKGDDDEDFLDDATTTGEISVPVSPDGALLMAHRSALGPMPPMSPEGSLAVQASLSAASDGAAMMGHSAGMALLGGLSASPSPGLEFLGPPLEIISGISPQRPAPVLEPPQYAREQLGSGRPNVSPEIVAYVSQLEAENRYLKACLAQCSGQGAGGVGLSTTPHQEQSPNGSLQLQSMMLQQQLPQLPVHMPPQLPQLPGFARPAAAVPPEVLAATRPLLSSACGDSASAGNLAAFWDCAAGMGQPGLSADAVPFWPSTSQAPWQEMGAADLAAGRFHAVGPGSAGMALAGDNPWSS